MFCLVPKNQISIHHISPILKNRNTFMQVNQDIL